MKKILLPVFIISFCSLHAQDSTDRCTLSSLFCPSGNSSLKNPLYTWEKTEAIPYYSTQSPSGYKDAHYKLNYCPFVCPVPSGTDGCDIDASTALYYFVYYPTNFVDYNTCKLPALIMFHSGGFSECSDPDQDGLNYFCESMAARGFVVFSCQYRVGVIPDQRPIPGVINPVGPKEEYVSAQQILAIYRACQDARGAIRSIIKRQNNETSGDNWNDPYRINTNKIFVGGMSAGSVIAMNAVYYQSQNTFQSMIDAVFPNVSSSLGSINPNFYYAAPPTLPSDDFLPNIQGCLNMWGSMFIPKSDFSNPYNFFSNNVYMPPLISFAGAKDEVFDIYNQPIYFSPNSATNVPLCGNTYSRNFGKETHCLISSQYITSQTGDGSEYQYGIGSKTIFDIFKNSRFSELYLDCQMMHGLDKDDVTCGTCTLNPNPFKKPGMFSNCVQCGYKSNFGTLYNNQTQTFDYIAGRVATFFQAIITNTTGVVNNKEFVKQKNNRYGCGAADNPPSFTPIICEQ